MVFAVFSWMCAVVSLAALCYGLRALSRSPRNAALAALCVYFLSESVSYVVDLDAFRGRIIAAFGFPNATTLIVQISVVVLTAAQQVTVVHLVLPPAAARRSTRWIVVCYGAAITVLVLLFRAADPHGHAPSQENVYLDLHETGYSLYFCYYLAVCVIGRLQTVVFAFRYVRAIPDFFLRLGLWFVAAGSALILLYCAVRYWQVAALHVPGLTGPWKWLFWFVADVGTLMQLFGWTVPSWGPGIGAVARGVRSYRSYLRLAPLWRAVYVAAPGLVLEPPTTRLLGWVPPRLLPYHLYRRIIEIRDAELVLRQAADPIALHRLEQARGLPHEALCEAAMLHSALRAGAALPLPGGAAEEGPPARRDAPDAGLAEETASLIRVSEAFQLLERRRATAAPARAGAGVSALPAPRKAGRTARARTPRR